MKKATYQTKMRWTAGVMYFLLFVYQLLVYRMFNSDYSFVSLPTALFAEILLVVPFAIGAIKLLAGEGTVAKGVRRGVVVASLLYVLFEVINYKVLAEYTAAALSAMFPNSFAVAAVSTQNVMQYVVIVLRLVLVVLAAFFVITSADDGKPKDADEDDEDDEGSEDALADEMPKETDADEKKEDAPVDKEPTEEDKEFFKSPKND